jgi:hypothetical protein
MNDCGFGGITRWFVEMGCSMESDKKGEMRTQVAQPVRTFLMNGGGRLPDGINYKHR